MKLLTQCVTLRILCPDPLLNTILKVQLVWGASNSSGAKLCVMLLLMVLDRILSLKNDSN